MLQHESFAESFVEEDPREALLRHAQAAEGTLFVFDRRVVAPYKCVLENPYWVNPAYKKTQPKTIYDEGKYEEPEMPRRQ